MKRCGIYLITHLASERRYVGQSIDIDRRLVQHGVGRRESGHLAAAVNLYGWAAFEATVLEECSRDALNERERWHIADRLSLHPDGFNLTDGGQRYVFADEVRARISTATKKGQTADVRARMSASMKGKPKSNEWRAAMSKRMQSNPDGYAHLVTASRNQSVETREKIAASKRGKKASPETCARISAAKTAAHAAAQAAGIQNKASEETKAKMAESQRRRMATPKARADLAARARNAAGVFL